MHLLLHPEYLAQFDIIFLPYEYFKADYDYYIAKQPSLRRELRVIHYNSPLFCMEWWRVVLDEVHLVENSIRLLYRCASLQYENIWCISGTPFNRNLSEMQETMFLMKIPQYNNISVWKECIRVLFFLIFLICRSRFRSESTEWPICCPTWSPNTIGEPRSEIWNGFRRVWFLRSLVVSSLCF